MSYTSIKHLHILFAVSSITLLLLRWTLQSIGINWRKHGWLQIVPHINDTLLIIAAIALISISKQYPWDTPWLGLKIVAVLVYIVCGKKLLSNNETNKRKHLSGAITISMVCLIAYLAINKPTLF